MAENSRTSPFLPIFHACVDLQTASSGLIFRIFLALPNHIFQHLNAAALTLRSSYFFHFIQMRFTNSFNQSILFIIPVLMTFLQLKYQGNNQKGPFSTHPKTMQVAAIGSIVYYLACAAQLQFFLLRRRFAVVARHCSLWSGHLSVASLASVLLPDSLSPFVYTLFVLLSAIELLHWLYHKFVIEEEGGEFQACRRCICQFLMRFAANSSGQMPQILPR